MKANIYALIGEKDSGKSTSISYLTGRTTGPYSEARILLKNGGYINVLPKIMSLQEHNISPAQSVKLIEDYYSKISNKFPYVEITANVLLTMRFDAFQNIGITGSRLQPRAEEYLSEYLKKGWNLKSLVLYCDEGDKKRPHFLHYGAPLLYHPDATSNSFEAMAGKIRRHFGWA